MSSTQPSWLLLVALALSACSRQRGCSELEVQVAGDHAHSVRVSAEKVKQAKGGAYRVHGADHDHAFVLKDEDMQELTHGTPVTVRSSSTNAHTHELTIRCKD